MIQVTSWTLGKTGELGHMIRFPVRVAALISCQSIAGTANTDVEENFLRPINFCSFWADGLENPKVSNNDTDRRAGRIVDPVPETKSIQLSACFFATLSSSLFGNC